MFILFGTNPKVYHILLVIHPITMVGLIPVLVGWIPWMAHEYSTNINGSSPMRFFWFNPNISCGGETPSNSLAPHYRDTAPNLYFQTTGYSTYPHVIERGTWKSSRNMGLVVFFFIFSSWNRDLPRSATVDIWHHRSVIHPILLSLIFHEDIWLESMLQLISRSLFCDIPDSYPIFLQFLSRFDPIIILNIVPT